jgi:hypothetical protein
MDNATQQIKVSTQDAGKMPYVAIKKDEVIEVLKTLEGLKKKLQKLLTA